MQHRSGPRPLQWLVGRGLRDTPGARPLVAARAKKGNEWEKSRPGESVTHSRNAIATRRQHTQDSESAPVHNNLAIDENFVLTVASMLGIYFDLQFAPELRRHPDGVKA
jgi:hypothetical protein